MVNYQDTERQTHAWLPADNPTPHLTNVSLLNTFLDLKQYRKISSFLYPSPQSKPFLTPGVDYREKVRPVLCCTSSDVQKLQIIMYQTSHMNLQDKQQMNKTHGKKWHLIQKIQISHWHFKCPKKICSSGCLNLGLPNMLLLLLVVIQGICWETLFRLFLNCYIANQAFLNAVR